MENAEKVPKLQFTKSQQALLLDFLPWGFEP
jgi:hypothetical protein